MAGPVWVEDDSISKALSGLTGDLYSAKSAALYAKVAEEIAKSKQERTQSEEFWNAKKTLPGLIGGVQQAEAAPVPPDYQRNWATGATGGGALGSETVPIGGPAPLSAYSAPAEQEAVRAREARDQAIANARTKLTSGVGNVAALAMKSTDDAGKYYQQYGEGLNVIGMAPAGSAEETRRMAMINPTSFVPKEPINPYDAKHQEVILDKAAAGLTANGVVDVTAAPLIRNMLESKYAPKMSMVETPTGPQPQTIQQPMTPRDAALYGALTKGQQPQAAAAAPPPAPAAAAAQAAPAGQKTADITTTAAPAPAVVPRTESAVAPAAPSAAPPAPAAKPFISPQGSVALGGSISPHPTPDTERRIATALQQVSPERQNMETILGFSIDPKTGQPNLSKLNNLPSYPAAAIYTSPFGNYDLAKGAGQYVESMRKGTENTPIQSYYNSAKAWIEPVLRLASGAAINQDEYRSYYSMFIPGPSDGPREIAEKFGRMRQWETAVASSATAGEAFQKMQSLAGNREDVERMRVVLRNNPDAANRPFSEIINQQPQPGGTTAAPGGGSSADQQALSWANANPNDPRAAQIRQRLGAQ